MAWLGGGRATRAYMVCQPSTNFGEEALTHFPNHPASVRVRQDVLLDGVLDFFAERVLGEGRHEYARAESAAESARQRKLEKEADALERAVDDLDRSTRGRLGHSTRSS